MEKFEVNQDWLKACGRDYEPSAFEVDHTEKCALTGKSYVHLVDPMFTSVRRLWVVDALRGKIIATFKVSTKTYAGRLARKNSGWARPGHFDKGIPHGSISRERSISVLLTVAESNEGWQKWPATLGAMGYSSL